VKIFFFKSLYFKNSSVKIKIIILLFKSIYIKNYNIGSVKIKVDRVQSIAFRQLPTLGLNARSPDADGEALILFLHTVPNQCSCGTAWNVVHACCCCCARVCFAYHCVKFGVNRLTEHAIRCKKKEEIRHFVTVAIGSGWY
jgi:hypothetical protein